MRKSTIYTYLILGIVLGGWMGCAQNASPVGENVDPNDGDSTSHSQDTDPTDADTDPTDSNDATDASDTTPEPEEDPTTGGLDCSVDAGICENPFVCMLEVCRIPLASVSEAEVEFTFLQPEELDDVFDLFKTFTAGLKFFAIEVDAETAIPGRMGARYGSADIESENPLQVAWQRPDELENIFFTPYVPEQDSDDGTRWISEMFTYMLRADAEFQFGTYLNNASIALDILDAVVVHEQDVEGGNSVGIVTGHLTREEAEDRELGSHQDLEGIMQNFVCTQTEYVPAPTAGAPADDNIIWHLSDVLDCNEAEMDVDRDGDGVLDTYQVELELVLGAAIIPAPEG